VCGAHCLESTAMWAITAGRPEVAATLLGAAQAVRAGLGVPVPWWDRSLTTQATSAARSALGSAGFDDAASTGGSLSFERALELAEDATAEPTARRTHAE